MERQDWPTAWLFTDERIDRELDEAMRRAATAGAGIVVRHHRSSLERRRGLAEQVKGLGAVFAVARDVELAAQVGAALIHNPSACATELPFSLSVHDDAEARLAAERRPALVFISPVHETRSHEGAKPLGEERAIELMLMAGRPAIALGGMDDRSGRALIERGFHGWAGIDCWLRT
jgi:thiamine-phosphate pyrophosphorylase